MMNQILERANRQPIRLTLDKMLLRFGERNAACILKTISETNGSLCFTCTHGGFPQEYELVIDAVIDPYPNFVLVN